MGLSIPVNNIKFVFAFLLLISGIAGFYYLGDSPMVIRVLSVLGGLLLAAAVAAFTTQGQDFFTFCKASSEETKKVVWPTRKETIQTSGIVFAFVVAMAMFLWLIDAGLMSAVKFMMDQEG